MADFSLHPEVLKGRNRRLFHEWQELQRHLDARPDIAWSVRRTNSLGLPTAYSVVFHIHSICGVENIERLNTYNPPIFADRFLMEIDLPPGYPCVDAPPSFRFTDTDSHGLKVARPWHPNIRFFGNQAGHVCLNMTDTYDSLAWGVERVAHYLRYDLYHATQEPPYPEDFKVAAWVVAQGEPFGWIYFEQ